MRSSRVVRASDSKCRSRNCPGYGPSILRHSGIWGAADEAGWIMYIKRKNRNLSNAIQYRNNLRYHFAKKCYIIRKHNSIVETSSSLCRYLIKHEIVFSVRKKSSPVFYDTPQSPSLSPSYPLYSRRRQRGKGCPKSMQLLPGGR